MPSAASSSTRARAPASSAPASRPASAHAGDRRFGRERRRARAAPCAAPCRGWSACSSPPSRRRRGSPATAAARRSLPEIGAEPVVADLLVRRIVPDDADHVARAERHLDDVARRDARMPVGDAIANRAPATATGSRTETRPASAPFRPNDGRSPAEQVAGRVCKTRSHRAGRAPSIQSTPSFRYRSAGCLSRDG